MTKGGKTTQNIKIDSNQKLQEVKKRGRPFNYIHSDETKEKMKNSLQTISEHLKTMASTTENKKRVSTTIKKYYDEQKIKKLMELDLSKDYNEYIKEIYDKNGDICSYKIYINRTKRFYVSGKGETLDEKYERLKNIILIAKELKSKNCEDHSKE